jgi:tRNA(adenine34) deaminase
MFTNEYWMNQAFKEAEKALQIREVPVGAIVVLNDVIIGKGYNQVEQLKDATAHAEILAITAASNYIDNWRLENAVLYVTKEPCVMCAGAVLNSRVSRVVFSAYDKKFGAGGSKYDLMRENSKWFVEIIPGILNDRGEGMLADFFKDLRVKNKFIGM